MTAPRRRKRTPVDWPEVRERLARTQAALESALMLTPERARALMDERARSLASAGTGGGQTQETLEVVTFALGREHYGIETRFVREVRRLADLTPVPGVPDFVLGITNLRGEALAVIDLRRFFGIAGTGLADLSRVVVLGTEHDEFGILADVAHAVVRIPASAALAPPESVAGVGRGYLRGVTRDALVVLDGTALLEDRRLVVDHGAAELRT
ncbi:MAG: chemotaxis protein CheW [Myxococcota bacterium]